MIAVISTLLILSMVYGISYAIFVTVTFLGVNGLMLIMLVVAIASILTTPNLEAKKEEKNPDDVL